MELTELAREEKSYTRVVSFGEEARALLPSVGDPKRELILTSALMEAYDKADHLAGVALTSLNIGQVFVRSNIARIHRRRGELEPAIELLERDQALPSSTASAIFAAV